MVKYSILLYRDPALIPMYLSKWARSSTPICLLASYHPPRSVSCVRLLRFSANNLIKDLLIPWNGGQCNSPLLSNEIAGELTGTKTLTKCPQSDRPPHSSSASPLAHMHKPPSSATST